MMLLCLSDDEPEKPTYHNLALSHAQYQPDGSYLKKKKINLTIASD